MTHDAGITTGPRRLPLIPVERLSAEQHGVEDATYHRVLDRFGERGVFDLIAVNGFYSFVSMCLNVDRTPLPEGVTPPLK